MPLYVALAAVLLGVAVDITALGREWTFSFVDGVAVGVAVAGAVVARRRGRVCFDGALLGYLGLLAVVALQVAVRADTPAVIGGASRFVTAALLVFGLSQLALARAEDRNEEWTDLWRWPVAVSVFGSVLAVWVVVPLIRALTDPSIASFYDIKKAVVTPLGASNYLAAFLLFALVVSLVHAVDRDRRWLPPTVVVLVGLLATMSRGAVAAAFLVVLGLAVVWRRRHVVVRVVAAAGVAGVVLGLVAVAAVALAWSPANDDPVARRVETSAIDVRETRQPSAVATTPPEDGGDDGDGTGLSQLDGVLTDIAFGGRRQLYRASWDAFVDHPVLGVGINRLDTYTGRGGHPPHVNAHNLVLHALATTGVLGTLAYLSIWGVALWRLWALPPSAARLALLAGLGALLLHAQVEALTHTRAVEALLAIVLALTGAASDSFAVRHRQRATTGR